MFNLDARAGTQRQWSLHACGELLGDKQTAAYLDAVTCYRYQQQSSMHDYFLNQRLRGQHVLEIGIGNPCMGWYVPYSGLKTYTGSFVR